jgi:hypothetical protein
MMRSYICILYLHVVALDTNQGYALGTDTGTLAMILGLTAQRKCQLTLMYFLRLNLLEKLINRTECLQLWIALKTEEKNQDILFTLLWCTKCLIINDFLVFRKVWSPGAEMRWDVQKQSGCIIPQAYSTSAHTLTNEATFKGKLHWVEITR